ncbi:MAG TPA: ATP-binding protein [Gemmatimonadales bacterium]|jgi:signal transduction histidine kinase
MLPTVRGVSIERKLPLLISALLLVVIIVLTGSALREVQRLAIVAARARLEALASQFATSSTDGYRRRIATLSATGHNDTLVQLVQSTTPATRAAATKFLKPMTADTSQDIGVQVEDGSGTRLFVLGTAPIDSLAPMGRVADSANFGPFVDHAGLIVYPTSAPIITGNHVIGRLIQWRRLQLSERASKAIADLIGLNGAVYVGNPAGDVWIDLAGHRGVRAPITDPRGGFIEFTRPGAGAQMTAIKPIIGTPWQIEIDFPRSAILSGREVFLRRFGVVVILLLVLGVVTGVVASRRIARPLQELTGAAESIAGGDFSRHIGEYGNDEVGRLARAFRVMAEKVQATQAGLETQVSNRTAELRAAMKTVEDTRDELVRKERLAILGQLSSGVGHELRNPLGVMNNAVYYLEAVLTDATPTTLEYLGILKTQIALSEKIVRDLLDFARLKNPDRHTVPIDAIVADNLKSIPAPANIQTLTELSPSVPTVCADPVHVKQILDNLTANAYQAMAQTGGTVTIRATPDGPGNVQIDVIDTGPGIARENLDKVFEPLFTTKARGIGLGLAVSRTLATSNGGTLTAMSAPGKGATFRLVLPAEERVSA